MLVLRAEDLGDLDRVTRIIKLVGFVNCTDGFTGQPKVVNGASDLFAEVRRGSVTVGCKVTQLDPRVTEVPRATRLGRSVGQGCGSLLPWPGKNGAVALRWRRHDLVRPCCSTRSGVL